MTTNNMPEILFEDFIVRLRRFNQKSIVDSIRSIMWRDTEKVRLPDQYQHIFDSYGTKIIALAYATCNKYRDKKITTIGEAYKLCGTCINLKSSVLDDGFKDEETRQIANELKKYIPIELVDIEAIKKSKIIILMQRLLAEQTNHVSTNLNEFYNDFLILKLLDQRTSGIASRKIHDEFNVSIESLFRSGFAIFALAADQSALGQFDLTTFTVDKDDAHLLKLDKSALIKLCSEISYTETDLIKEWYPQLQQQHEYYKRHYPLPFYKHPLLRLNKEDTDSQKYLLPSPSTFVRAWRQAIFSRICSADKSVGNQLGNAIADHFIGALQELIGKDRVSRIDDTTKHADILIHLDRVNIFVEVKTDIGSFLDKSLVDPVGLSKVWGRLYHAFLQCSYSAKKHGEENKLNVALVLIADHVTTSHFSFESYAHEGAIFKELSLEAAELLSWNELEHLLITTRISDIENALIEKWKTPNPWTVGSMSSLSYANRHSPIEPLYIKKADESLWNGILNKERTNKD